MKICKNCGSTLNDNEDFCIICESYCNDMKITKPEDNIEPKVKDKEKSISPKLKKFIIIGIAVLVVVVIVSIIRDVNRGTPDEVLEQYMTAICEKDAKKYVECMAVPNIDKQDVYTGVWAGFMIQDELFSSGEMTYVVQDIESMSFLENKRFWATDVADSAYVTDSKVGTMAKANVYVNVSAGSYTNTIYYEVYIGIYKGQWKIIAYEMQ